MPDKVDHNFLLYARTMAEKIKKLHKRWNNRKQCYRTEFGWGRFKTFDTLLSGSVMLWHGFGFSSSCLEETEAKSMFLQTGQLGKHISEFFKAWFQKKSWKITRITICHDPYFPCVSFFLFSVYVFALACLFPGPPSHLWPVPFLSSCPVLPWLITRVYLIPRCPLISCWYLY